MLHIVDVEDSGYLDNFCTTDSDTYGQPYDYDSVMHYGPRTFSKYPKDSTKYTMRPKDSSKTIGQQSHISKIDAVKLRKMYGCA